MNTQMVPRDYLHPPLMFASGNHTAAFSSVFEPQSVTNVSQLKDLFFFFKIESLLRILLGYFFSSRVEKREEKKYQKK